MSISIGPKIPVIIRVSEGDPWTAPGNSMLRALQPLVQPNVISVTLATPPGSPSNGNTYIVGTAGTGAWTGKDNNVAYWSTDNPSVPDGEWEFYAPRAGWMVVNLTDNRPYIFDGAVWGVFSGSVGQKQTTVSSAQLLNLNSVPITIIPAPGVGNAIQVVSYSYQFNAGGTPYGILGGDALRLVPSLSAPSTALSVPATGLLDTVGVTNKLFLFGPLTGLVYDTADWDDSPLLLTYNSSQNPTAGNGTLFVNVLYSIIPIA